MRVLNRSNAVVQGIAWGLMIVAAVSGCCVVSGCANLADAPAWVQVLSGYDEPPDIEPVPEGTETLLRGLCIGLNRVNPLAYDGWSGPLADCEIDALEVAKLWEADGISCDALLTEAATRDGAHMALRERTTGMNRDSRLFVALSGHGGQVIDWGGDEADGLDESICLYDGEWSDDETDKALHAAPPIKIIWICDTCHSGTMGRGRPVLFSREATEGIRCQVILLAGCSEDKTSASTGVGGAWTLALRATWDARMSPVEWFEAASALMDQNEQRPVYAEYGPVTDEFRHGAMVPLAW